MIGANAPHSRGVFAFDALDFRTSDECDGTPARRWRGPMGSVTGMGST
jgi:hypothetical protein